MIAFSSLNPTEQIILRKKISNIIKVYKKTSDIDISEEDIFILCPSRDKINDISPIFINKVLYPKNYQPITYFKKMKNFLRSRI